MKIDLNEKLINFESGINPNSYDLYRENYSNKFIKYVKCYAPGKLLRDWNTGNPIIDFISYEEYFKSIGIHEFFLGCDKNTFPELRYKVINPWGFVGFQFGEELLMSLGYYVPKMANLDGVQSNNKQYPEHYTLIEDNYLWAKGNTKTFHKGTYTTIIATDTNCWNGSFTGINNISSFEDLQCRNAQNIIINNSQKYNLKIIIEEFDKAWLDKKIKSDPLLSWSGILAASHLCGADSVKKMLNKNEFSYDELGTNITYYLKNFKDLECNINDLITSI